MDIVYGAADPENVFICTVWWLVGPMDEETKKTPIP
jgi:hypothetical protein